MCLRRIMAVLATLGLAACATQSGSSEGDALRRDRSAATGEAARSSPEPEARLRTLLLYPGTPRDQAEDAVHGWGGRVLASFDGPAAIIQIAPSAAHGLARDLPDAVVTREAISDVELIELAPEAVGFWNRQLGATTAAVGPPAGAREPAPSGRLNVVPPQESQVNMPPELEAEAQSALRTFLRCLSSGPTSLGCLEDLIAPEAEGELGPQLEREARIARERNIDTSEYAFVLQSYDGQEARYEIQRGGHPYGTVHVVRRERSWLVSFIDP